jgi:hypothetical protein
MELPDIATLLAFIQKLKLTSRSQVVLGSGSVAALVLILRYILSKETKYISDLSKVGRLSRLTTGADSEGYDVIIVGGGTCSWLVHCWAHSQGSML